MAQDEAGLRARHEALLLGLNHELRTPLAVIHSHAELLAQSTLDDDQRRLVAGVLAAADRALETLEALIDPTRKRAGSTGVPKA